MPTWAIVLTLLVSNLLFLILGYVFGTNANQVSPPPTE